MKGGVSMKGRDALQRTPLDLYLVVRECYTVLLPKIIKAF